MRTVEVTSVALETISGIGKASGKPFSFDKQTVYLHVEGQPYPEKSEIIINEGTTPYAIGKYEIAPASIVVDRNGRLALEPVLIRKSDSKVKAA